MNGIEPISDEVLTEILKKETKQKKDNLHFPKIVTAIFAMIAGITIGLTHGVLAGLIAAAIPLLVISGVIAFLHFFPN